MCCHRLKRTGSLTTWEGSQRTRTSLQVFKSLSTQNINQTFNSIRLGQFCGWVTSKLTFPWKLSIKLSQALSTCSWVRLWRWISIPFSNLETSQCLTLISDNGTVLKRLLRSRLTSTLFLRMETKLSLRLCRSWVSGPRNKLNSKATPFLWYQSLLQSLVFWLSQSLLFH